MDNTRHFLNGIANSTALIMTVQQISTAVRIFGTQKQIDAAL